MAKTKRSSRDVLTIPASSLRQYRFPLQRIEDLGRSVDTFRVPRARGFISQAELRKLVDKNLIEVMKGARRRLRSPTTDPVREGRKLVAAFARRASKRAGINIPKGLPEDMFGAATAVLEGESQTAAWPRNQSLRIGRVRHEGRVVLLLNTGEGLEVLGEGNANRSGEPDFIDNALWVVDFLGELILGIIGIAGVRVKPGANVGEVAKKLLTRDKVKQALKVLLTGALTLDSIIQFIKALLEEDDVIDLLLTILDCTFWGILWTLATFAAKLSPGVGQALIAASIGILIGELLIKLARGPELAER